MSKSIITLLRFQTKKFTSMASLALKTLMKSTTSTGMDHHSTASNHQDKSSSSLRDKPSPEDWKLS